MPYDARLSIAQRFTLGGEERVNRLKVVEQWNYVQLYMKNGEHNVGMRLNKKMVEELKMFLDRVDIKDES